MSYIASLATYLTNLQAEGRITFTREEAIAALGITEGAFLKTAARLQKRHRLFNPRHGFYVAVPPQFLSWHAPPPSWYIDPLMQHESQPSVGPPIAMKISWITKVDGDEFVGFATHTQPHEFADGEGRGRCTDKRSTIDRPASLMVPQRSPDCSNIAR
jgi:hypothetical protein